MHTSTSLTFYTAIFAAFSGVLAEELMIFCRHVRTELYPIDRASLLFHGSCKLLLFSYTNSIHVPYNYCSLLFQFIFLIIIIHVPYNDYTIHHMPRIWQVKSYSHIMFRTSHNPRNCCTNMSYQCACINSILWALDGFALIHVTALQQTPTEKQYTVHI